MLVILRHTYAEIPLQVDAQHFPTQVLRYSITNPTTSQPVTVIRNNFRRGPPEHQQQQEVPWYQGKYIRKNKPKKDSTIIHRKPKNKLRLPSIVQLMIISIYCPNSNKGKLQRKNWIEQCTGMSCSNETGVA